MNEVREGYIEEELETELVLEPEDMSETEWKFLKEIFGFHDNENVTNITLPEKTLIKSFIE